MLCCLSIAVKHSTTLVFVVDIFFENIVFALNTSAKEKLWSLGRVIFAQVTALASWLNTRKRCRKISGCSSFLTASSPTNLRENS